MTVHEIASNMQSQIYKLAKDGMLAVVTRGKYIFFGSAIDFLHNYLLYGAMFHFGDGSFLMPKSPFGLLHHPVHLHCRVSKHILPVLFSHGEIAVDAIGLHRL